jgi:DNA polymerase (family 10)
VDGARSSNEDVGVVNGRVAAQLEELAALLELAGTGYYSIRAYRRAAAVVRALPVSVATLVGEGRVRELRGFGPGLEQRLRELVETGELAEVARLRESTALEVAAFGQLIGLGAKRSTAIADALGVRTVADFEEAAARGRLREVPGIGPKSEARILAALARARHAGPALTIRRARDLTRQIAVALGGIEAGDARRWVDQARRLAVVVESSDAAAARERFASLPQIVTMLDPDRGVTADGVPVELVVAPGASLGTELIRATGPAEYVAALEPLPGRRDEVAVYRALRRPFLPPELRGVWPDDREPPALVEPADIRGDLHAHTTSSDGKATVLEMGRAARARGYEYLAICDHTPSVGVVPGLDADALRRQAEEIARAGEELAPFRLLRGIECDIRKDGRLDLDDDVLGELDWVQLSLHAGQRAPRDELTARVTEAMRHPAVRCLSHPTGRLLGHRPENALDLERTIEVALETGVALEVNGLPDRLDLSGEHVRVALGAGVAIVCSTDAHSVAGLDNMELSVHTARRGGATASCVLNTRPLSEVLTKPAPR